MSVEQLSIKISEIFKRLVEQNLTQRLFKKLQAGQTALDYQTLFQASGQIVGSSYWNSIRLADISKILDTVIANLTVRIADNTQ